MNEPKQIDVDALQVAVDDWVIGQYREDAGAFIEWFGVNRSMMGYVVGDDRLRRLLTGLVLCPHCHYAFRVSPLGEDDDRRCMYKVFVDAAGPRV